MGNYFQKESIAFLLNDHQESCDIIGSDPTTEVDQSLEDNSNNLPTEKSEVLYQLGIQFFKRRKLNKCYADAFYCFERAVKLKHKEANNLLGFCYMLGVGVTQNENEAISCFQKAADAGSPFAQYNLALLKHDKLNNLEKATECDFLLAQNALGAHYYNEKNEEKRCLAPNFFRLAMSQDDPLAEYNLGLCYYYGIGVEPDYHNYHIAVKYFASAASNDLAYAQNMLGVCYAIGRGVDKNLSMAIKYFQQASSNKHANASFNLAMCYLDSENEQKDLASEYMRLAAEEGCVYAIYNRGIDFYYGRHGTKQDYVQAVKCFEMANVLPEAKNMLGVCYATGRGTAVHLARAAALFTSAASSNNLEAIYNLGLCHLLGIYYIQSASNAQNYFIRYRNLKNNAKESGNITDNTVWDSASNAASMADDFEAIDIKDLTNLAKTGLPDAQFELGKRFSHGINVAQDFAKSIRWWQRAASQGHAQAQYNLGCCYLAGGKGVSIDILKRLESFFAWQRLKETRKHDTN